MLREQNSQQRVHQSYFVWALLTVCILDIALSSVYGLLVSLDRINPASRSLLLLQVVITAFVFFGSVAVVIKTRKRSSDSRVQAERGSQLILRDLVHEVDLLIARKAGGIPLTKEQKKVFEGRRRNIFRKMRGSADVVITRIRHVAARISLVSILASLLFGGGLLLLPSMVRYVHDLRATPWLLGSILQGILVFVLIFKRRWSSLPIFTLYAIFSFLSGVGLYVVYNLTVIRSIYFGFYWGTEGINIFLGLGVVYEVFRKLLVPYPALRRLATHGFLVVVLLLVVLGLVVIHGEPIGVSASITGVFLTIEQAARVLEVGSLCFLFSFASAFRLAWRHEIFGIALGFALVAAVELVTITMRIQFWSSAVSIITLARSVAFSLSLVIWIGYLLWPDLTRVPSEMPKKAQLEQWNRAVMELIYQ